MSLLFTYDRVIDNDLEEPVNVIINNSKWKLLVGLVFLNFISSKSLGNLITSYCDPMITWKITYWQDMSVNFSRVDYRLLSRTFDSVKELCAWKNTIYLEHFGQIIFKSEFDCHEADQTVDSYILVVQL